MSDRVSKSLRLMKVFIEVYIDNQSVFVIVYNDGNSFCRKEVNWKKKQQKLGPFTSYTDFVF
jgi:hypothetical protein